MSNNTVSNEEFQRHNGVNSFFCIKCGWVGALTPTLGMARVVSPGLFAWGECGVNGGS